MKGSVNSYRRDLLETPHLVDLILCRPDVFPPTPTDAQRIIRSCVANVEQARCRAVARALVCRDLWRVEVTR